MAPPSGVKLTSDTRLEAPILDELDNFLANQGEAESKVEAEFGLQGLTLDISLFTGELRDSFEATGIFPKGLFLGPLSTDITASGRVDFGYRDPRRGPSFFSSFGGGNFRTDAASHAEGSFFKFGFGVVKREEPTWRLGNEKYSLDIGGGTGAFGLGLSIFNYDDISGSPVVRLDFIDDSRTLSLRLDRFTLGVKFFSGSEGMNFLGSDIPGCEGKLCSTSAYVPGAWTEPVSFSLSYDFGERLEAEENKKSLDPGEVYTRISDFAVQRIRNQTRLQGVAQLVDTRVLMESGVQGAVDSRDLAAKARLGMSFYHVQGNWAMGDLAWELNQTLQLANSNERAIVLSAEAATSLALGLHAFVDRGEEGAPGNFSPRASRMLFYQNLEVQALGILGGYGLLGDPEGSKNEKIYFYTLHGLLAAAGIVGTLLYAQPFNPDPDSKAFNGHEGIIDPNELNTDMENRFLWTSLLVIPAFYSLNAFLNLKNVNLGTVPLPEGGVMAGAEGKF